MKRGRLPSPTPGRNRDMQDPVRRVGPALSPGNKGVSQRESRRMHPRAIDIPKEVRAIPRVGIFGVVLWILSLLSQYSAIWKAKGFRGVSNVMDDEQKPTEMTKGRKRTESAMFDTVREQRIRAAWLYYVEGLNQQEAASVLGVTRLQVTRFLADARKRGEVIIQINSDLQSIVEVQRRIETRYGVSRVIVAPRSDPTSDPIKPIAVAAGRFMSDYIQDGMTMGVGWGRTLYSTLPHIQGRDLEDIRVVSLLGGIAEAKRFNPAEFAWQFAERFNGEGYLVPAPALVDSVETKHALLEHCGITQIFELANSLDVAFISTGGIMGLNTSYRVGHVSEADRKSLINAGVVGDILYNFINIEGEIVDHPVNDRSISLDIGKLKRAKDIVLISGGSEKVEALIGTLKLLQPSYFITDEITATTIAEYEAGDA